VDRFPSVQNNANIISEFIKGLRILKGVFAKVSNKAQFVDGRL